MQWQFVIPLVFLLSVSVVPVFADGVPFILPDNPLWKIKVIFEDISEMVTFDNVEKTRLIANHALERQAEIVNCNSCLREHLIVAEQIRQESR